VPGYRQMMAITANGNMVRLIFITHPSRTIE
jgi:hypothetical protein